MTKVLRKYFMLFAVLSMILLTACGGGEGDSDNNGNKSAENDYNTATVNSNLVGEWYLYSESGKIVKANDSGKTDLLNLKSNGNFNLIGYFSTEYSNYIQTNNNIEDNTTGTWSYSNGKLYLTSDGETYWTYASISNNTLTIRNPDSNDSLVYKKAANSSSGSQNTNNDNYMDNKSFSSLVTNLKPDDLYEYEFESNCVITGKNFGETKKDLYLTSSFNKYKKKIDSSTVNWTDTQISFPIPIEDLEKNITYESEIYVNVNHNNQIEEIGDFYFHRLKIGAEILGSGIGGEYITLEDENILDNYRSATKFYIDSIIINDIDWKHTYSTLPYEPTKIFIPDNLDAGKKQLIVKIRDKTYETNCFYEIKQPNINYADIKESNWASNELIITGSNFSNSGYIEIIYELEDEIKNEKVYSYDSQCFWYSNEITYRMKNKYENLKSCRVKVIAGSSGKLVSNEVECNIN